MSLRFHVRRSPCYRYYPQVYLQYWAHIYRYMLEAAGWKLGPDGLRAKDGQKAVVRLYYNSQNAQERTLAEYVQSDLKKVGIEMKIIGEEKQAYLDRQRTGDFELQYSLSWGTPYDPQSYLSSWRIPAHGDYQAQVGMCRVCCAGFLSLFPLP